MTASKENENKKPRGKGFAGAGANVPDNPLDDPAFFERVPLFQVYEQTLFNGLRLHERLYAKEGRFFIAEAGTYRGRGLKAMLERAAALGVRVHITGLDSFEGLPPLSDVDQAEAPENAAYLRRRLFADTTEREVQAFLADRDADGFTLVKGFFDQTLPTLPERRYLMAVIDCDLYSSHMDCMTYFYDRLLPGGVMFFDDYHSLQYPMAAKAINKFLARKPEKLFHLGYADAKGNDVKAYLVKR